MQAFFAHIPSELMRRNKRYVISHATPNARWREYEKPVHWLDASMLSNRACALENIDGTDDFAVADPVFRCYLSDTGLLVSLAFSDRPYLENELYRAVLQDQLQVNEGMLVDNVVAQCLKANGHRAYFCAERNPETRKTTMEIDFLIRQGKKIVPIEVKSSGSSSIKSLVRFKEKFGKCIGEAIVLHHGEINGRTTCGICRTTWQRCFESNSRTIRKVGVKFVSNSLAQKFRSRALFSQEEEKSVAVFCFGPL